MNEMSVLSAEELRAFATEGLLLLDRPLTWEIIGELLATSPAVDQSAGA